MNQQSDIGRFLTRYGPYLCLVAMIAAVAIFLPGDDESDVNAGGQFNDFSSDSNGNQSNDFGAGTDSSGAGSSGSDFSNGSQTVDTSTNGTTFAPSGGGGGAAPANPTPAGGGGAAAEPGSGQQGQGGGSNSPTPTQPPSAGGMVANCDPATGRIKTPSHRAPACVPAYTGNNGGATYQGVTGDTIKVGYYLAQGDPASDAILSAAGANDSDETIIEQYEDLAEYYGTHYETYGRTVENIYIQGSGPPTDDAVGRVDAKRMIDAGVFVSINAPNNIYVDELRAAGIMCICTVSQPNELYEKNAPFVWSGSLMSSSQGYFHRAEFIGKRLKGRNAVHAGDTLFQQSPRVFGLAYYDDQQQSYRPGIDFFISELRNKYGIELAAVVGYRGYPDTAQSQEAARPLIQKMKSSNVTSLVCACDPFAPIFFTQEATRQQYNPEWIITGSALTDTSLFARTYDQTQWRNAFGVSFLSARIPEEKSDLYHKLVWHHGHEPPAFTYGVIDAFPQIFWNGVHYAGPRLDPGTFRDGLFNAPPSGIGKITLPQISFGTKLWPFPDYTSFDDITLIWWDPTAQGEDEVGANGTGLYRYVDMGKRYLPGEQPNIDTKAFDLANTVTIYDDYPPGDAPPEYPSPAQG